jgi:hypothetical protein
MSSGGVIYSYIPSFKKIGKDAEGILKFYLRNLKDCSDDISDGKEFAVHAEMGSCGMMYIPSFMKIGLSV